ncbi:MAG: GAF domain-containing protein [Thermoleophilia bacterium]
MLEQPDRLRSLVEAGIALTSELSLDAVLQKIVETAAELTGARYAALGVIDRTGRELERFVHTGLPAEVVERIGPTPRGRGILGVLISEARPLRLHDLMRDRRAVGFPANHPPMHTFLGVPVVLRGVAYGNLYLTEKADGDDFTEEDEELVLLLASQAAVAIENARLYHANARWVRQLESMNELGNAIASELEQSKLLSLVAAQLVDLLEARLVLVLLPTPDGQMEIAAAADHVSAAELVGSRFPREESKVGRVLVRQRPARVDALADDPEVNHEFIRRVAQLTGLPVPTSGLFVPLVAGGREVGVIVAHDKLRADSNDLSFGDADLRLAELFAERAAVAVDLSARVAQDALRRVVTAQELERRRLARELHDETGQALTSILLGLRTVEEAPGEEARHDAFERLRDLIVQTLHGVRRLAVELRPRALDDFGLVPALERLTSSFAEQTGIQVEFEPQLGAERLPGEVETALYRLVQEALTNVVKHAGAGSVSILLTEAHGTVKAVIEDDGRGFAVGRSDDSGIGLVGMRERMALLGGTLAVESLPGQGTTLVAEVIAR